MNYFLVRAWIPVFLICFYLVFRKVGDFIKLFLFALINCTCLVLLICVSVFYFFFGLSLKNFYGANVTIQGLLTSLVFFMVYSDRIHRKLFDGLIAIVLSGFMVLSLGWLYEYPFYYDYSMLFNVDGLIKNWIYYPFFIHSQIICILIVLYFFYTRNFKINSKFLFISNIYLIYAVIMFSSANDIGSIRGISIFDMQILKWFLRLPSAFMLLFLFDENI